MLPILLGIKQCVNKNREKNRERDFNRMREVKIPGDTVNCEAGEGSRDFVERVLSESGEPAGKDSESGFRDGGAIDKGARDVLGRGGAVIGCLHIGHLKDFP